MKLEGWDADWKDVGNERKAFYSNLPPRTYRFRVMACNNSGVWNEAGAFLDFSIAPTIYQRTSFRVLAGAVFLALLFAGYRIRVQRVRRQEQKILDVSRRFRFCLDRVARWLCGLRQSQVAGIYGPVRRADEWVRLAWRRSSRRSGATS